MKPFRLLAAPPTPFHPDGALNLAVIEPLAAHLKAKGVSGAFVCGTTGEGSSLSTTERKEIAQRWMEAAGGELEIIIHVGHAAQVEAINLAAHAQSLGVTGIATTAPYYFKPANAAEVVNWLAPVAAAAPDLRFYYYHIPSFTGVDIPVTSILKLGREQIPNLAGAKFTHNHLLDFAASLEVDARFETFFGRDEMLLAGLSLGARSAVGSTYNFMAPLFLEMVAAFDRGDMAAAQKRQSLARRQIEALQAFGGHRAMKVVLKWQGIDCGPWRPPFTNLSVEEEQALRERWDAA